MRVLQIIDSLHPGGAERMAVNTANLLSENIEYSALCCTREEGSLKDQLDPKVGYLFASRKGSLGIFGIRRIYKFINKNRITHLHAHSTSIYTALLLKKINANLKLIWHDHYGNAEFLKNRKVTLLKLFRKKTDAIIVVNHLLKDWSLKNKLSSQVYFLNNFIPEKNLLKATLEQLPGIKGKRVVCLANFRPQKNQLLLLKMWKDIVTQFPDWSLLLVGRSFDDAYHESILKYRTQNALETSVHLMGSRTDVDQILQQSDIGVLSSSSEGLPLALLEYGKAGMPVVATDVGACREVVGDKGFVIDPLDGSSFKDALINLMENEQMRTSYGDQFKTHIQTHYSEQNYLDKLLEVYTSIND